MVTTSIMLIPQLVHTTQSGQKVIHPPQSSDLEDFPDCISGHCFCHDQVVGDSLPSPFSEESLLCTEQLLCISQIIKAKGSSVGAANWGSSFQLGLVWNQLHWLYCPFFQFSCKWWKMPGNVPHLCQPFCINCAEQPYRNLYFIKNICVPFSVTMVPKAVLKTLNQQSH